MTYLLEAKLAGTASLASAGGGLYLAVIGEPVLISIITSTAAVLMAGLSAYFAYKAKTTAVATHGIVNSRMTEFMEMAKKFYRGEGKLEEKSEQRAREALKAQAVAEATTKEKV